MASLECCTRGADNRPPPPGLAPPAAQPGAAAPADSGSAAARRPASVCHNRPTAPLLRNCFRKSYSRDKRLAAAAPP